MEKNTSNRKNVNSKKKIKSSIIKNDKALLDFFNVKLTQREKEKIFNILNLMK